MGKKICGMLLALAMLFGVAGAVSPGYAQDSTSLKIAVLDTKAVLQASLAMKQINQTIQQHRVQSQNQFREKEQQLIQANQDLVRQRSVLAPEVFAQKKADLDKRAALIRSQAKARKQAISNVYAAGFKQVEQQLDQIIRELVDANGYDLIIAKNAAVYSTRDLDVTDQVIQKLNATLQTVSLPQLQN